MRWLGSEGNDARQLYGWHIARIVLPAFKLSRIFIPLVFASTIAGPPSWSTVGSCGLLNAPRAEGARGIKEKANHLPTQEACRFCKKAEMPSCASAAMEFMVMISFA